MQRTVMDEVREQEKKKKKHALFFLSGGGPVGIQIILSAPVSG